ncbi:hypothetical protein P3T36_007417 [Kitasatospora sp. MAP12-15]|uniref:hypothetical protein n=1 Tax=unclassified Kitasatospora TaxID=2633591 RepID=UPI00247406C4|nr:hypothetical protein [Kitasatospora sp. MAP12-44]MDH6109205.1 hypothetical protein [Kitasatospora sp. MAP12-44]
MYRVAAYVALGWAGILMVRALWNCFADVGVANFLLGIVYYGSTDKAGQAETSSLSYAVFYGIGAFFILRGSHWARGLVCGVALVEGYNRLRSLTGALFDHAQKGWFTSSTRGELLLATFALGLIVSVALVLMLTRRVGVHVPWQPPVSAWTVAAQQAIAGQQAMAGPQAAAGNPYGAAPLPQQTHPYGLAATPHPYQHQANPYQQQATHQQPQPADQPWPYGAAPGEFPQPPQPKPGPSDLPPQPQR